MVFKRIVLRAMLALLGGGLLGASPVSAQSDTLETVFQEWLTTFNSGDSEAIDAFYAEHLEIPRGRLIPANAEASCGFDAIRLEAQTPQSLTVLLAEKCFPSFHRLQLELAPDGDKPLSKFDLRPFAMDLVNLSHLVERYADRMAALDHHTGSLLITRGGETILARNWGTLAPDTDAPITADTPMLLASAGKMFTAVAVLQLVDAGKIDLDEPMRTYLPDYPNADMAQVTVRQLLQHRGGTGSMGVLGRGDGASRAMARTIAEIIALNGDRAPEFEPGSQFAYSNYGFLLLGAVVESASGEDYYDYIAKHIFDPTGMVNAGFPDRDHMQGVASGLTTFYGEEAEMVSNLDVLPWRGSPGGGGVASANDMLKFFTALQAGELLSPASFTLATSFDSETGGATGFSIAAPPFLLWGHGGNSYGMDVAAYYFPSVDSNFICLSTRDLSCGKLFSAWIPKIFGLNE